MVVLAAAAVPFVFVVLGAVLLDIRSVAHPRRGAAERAAPRDRQRQSRAQAREAAGAAART